MEINITLIMKTDFTWSSALGISSISFISIAVIYILIGVAGMIIIWKFGSGNVSEQYYFGKKVDELFFQKSTAQLNDELPQFSKYISYVMIAFCSFMVTAGVLQFGVARFALIEGYQWAYWTSVISNFVMLLVYWFVIIIPVINHYKVSYFDTWHPYAFIPTLLLPVAAIAGAIGIFGK